MRYLRIPASFCIMLLAGALTVLLLGRAQDTSLPAPETTLVPEGGKMFALFSSRTFASNEYPRFTLSYRDVDKLDFRVYKISDPIEFFTKLRNLHQSGEEDTQSLSRPRSALERFSYWKFTTLNTIKNFIRRQVNKKARSLVNKTFGDEYVLARRRPLNHADLQKIPLLNDYGLVESWREILQAITQTNYLTIPLSKKEPGVYLVEAACDDLRAYTLVFVTDLVVLSKNWNRKLIIYVINRYSGKPIENATLQLITPKRDSPLRSVLLSGTSSADGSWRVDLPQDFQGEDSLLLVSSGKDFAAVDVGRSLYIWGVSSYQPQSAFYTYTDRPVYRPGQTVYFKSILRQLTEKGPASVTGLADITVTDADGNTFYQTSLPVSDTGTISGSFTLAKDAVLGSYNINVQLSGMTGYYYFQVEEYKKPEYTVSIFFPQRRVLAGEKVNAVIQARYYFGAPVAQAAVEYRVYREPYYAPFSSDDPLLQFIQEEPQEYDFRYYSELVTEGKGTLDKEGQLRINFDTKQTVTNPEAEDFGQEYKYRIEAVVTDLARRDIRKSDSIPAVNGRFALQTATDRYVYKPNEEAEVEVTAIDHDGKPVAADFKLIALQVSWQKSADSVLRQVKQISEVSGRTDAHGTTKRRIKLPAEGEIELVAIAEDSNRKIISNRSLIWTTSDNIYDEYYFSEIKILSDRKFYRPGEEANILLLLPDSKAHLFISLEGHRLLRDWQLSAEGRTAKLKIRLDNTLLPEGVPNVWLNVAYVKEGRMISGMKSLDAPPLEKLLKVNIETDKPVYQPGETAVYKITTTDLVGEPVSAEVSFGLVDEAIYAIQSEYLQNIASFFYSRITSNVHTGFCNEYDFSGYSSKEAWKLAAERNNLKQRKPFAALKTQPRIDIRKNFKDTAFWSANVQTDDQGRAEISVDLPDNLTTWRATARAVTSDTKVGSAVQKVIVRKDLLVRLATPRFLTEGDEATISAIVHNYLKTPQKVTLSIQTSGVTMTESARLLEHNIEPNGRQRVDWKVKADNVTNATFKVIASSAEASDGVELTIPVLPHGIRIGHAESAVLTEANSTAELKTNIGQNASPSTIQIRVDLAPSVTGVALAALDYLTSYPYGCVEQTMSSFLPNIVVARALRANVTKADEASLDDKVKKGLERLYDFQHKDGSWGWWKTDPADLYMTAYVVIGLTEASRAGYSVDQAVIKRARDYIKSELDSSRSWTDPRGLDERVYLLYALAVSGSESASRLSPLLKAESMLQPFSRALLALALLETGEREKAIELAQKIEATATGNNQESYWETISKFPIGEEDLSVEATALSVKVLARLLPQSPVLVKAARWLVNHRPNGYYWHSTRQTAAAIDALVDYAQVSGELEADYDWEVYINNQQVGTGHFSSTDATAGKIIRIMAEKPVIGTNTVRVVKTGPGTLIASLSSVYFTKETEAKPTGSTTLSINREYFLLDLTTDDQGQPVLRPKPLKGELSGGELILVRITLQGKPARYLIIEDPFPAGMEPFTDNEPPPGELPQIESFYDRREFRDDRVVWFLTTFRETTTWQYVLRSQIPGKFIAAPARAERMYQPQIRTNSASASFTIK